MVAVIYNSPLSGAVGSSINVIGSGFNLSTIVTITYDGANSATVSSDGSGAFTLAYTIPLSVAGNHIISATDGTNTSTAIFTIVEYCQISDISDWLGIDINSNTKPNRNQVISWIIRNQERIDRLTGHSWQSLKRYYRDEHDVPMGWYDYGRGLPIYLKHRNVQDFDTTKGDKVEIWNGVAWQTQAIDSSTFIYVDNVKGILYIRGYLFTIITRNRFRVTLRYGGNLEGDFIIPQDIVKACILMTAIDILSRDFKFSQVTYGGEGNIRKDEVMEKWQNEIDNIIWTHSEIQTVM